MSRKNKMYRAWEHNYPSEDAHSAFDFAWRHRKNEIESLQARVADLEEIEKAGWRSCIDHIIKPESACPVCEIEKLRNAVYSVIEGWTIPDGVRKILETAYYAKPTALLPDEAQED